MLSSALRIRQPHCCDSAPHSPAPPPPSGRRAHISLGLVLRLLQPQHGLGHDGLGLQRLTAVSGARTGWARSPDRQHARAVVRIEDIAPLASTPADVAGMAVNPTASVGLTQRLAWAGPALSRLALSSVAWAAHHCACRGLGHQGHRCSAVRKGWKSHLQLVGAENLQDPAPQRHAQARRVRPRHRPAPRVTSALELVAHARPPPLNSADVAGPCVAPRWP